jgi:hypothetical protein
VQAIIIRDAGLKDLGPFFVKIIEHKTFRVWGIIKRILRCLRRYLQIRMHCSGMRPGER